MPRLVSNRTSPEPSRSLSEPALKRDRKRFETKCLTMGVWSGHLVFKDDTPPGCAYFARTLRLLCAYFARTLRAGCFLKTKGFQF
jgi:hypothetical protein